MQCIINKMINIYNIYIWSFHNIQNIYRKNNENLRQLRWKKFRLYNTVWK
jgi:hypothetical protein